MINLTMIRDQIYFAYQQSLNNTPEGAKLREGMNSMAAGDWVYEITSHYRGETNIGKLVAGGRSLAIIDTIDNKRQNWENCQFIKIPAHIVTLIEHYRATQQPKPNAVKDAEEWLTEIEKGQHGWGYPWSPAYSDQEQEMDYQQEFKMFGLDHDEDGVDWGYIPGVPYEDLAKTICNLWNNAYKHVDELLTLIAEKDRRIAELETRLHEYERLQS